MTTEKPPDLLRAPGWPRAHVHVDLRSTPQEPEEAPVAMRFSIVVPLARFVCPCCGRP